MKKYTILTIAPALALLAVGCSSPVAMQSTEYDDMYYSSSDKTAYVQPEAPAQAYESFSDAEQQDALAEGEVLNPEYAGGVAGTSNYTGDEYYDGRTYNARDNWYRPNYSFVDPYWGRAYVPRYNPYMTYRDPFYSPYSYSAYAYDPYYPSFYDPFYSPYYGSGLSISIAYSMSFGRPYYGAWYPYNSFYNRGFYGGYYNNYYARSNYYYDSPVVRGKARRLQYGPRETRGAVLTGDTQQAGRTTRGEGINNVQEQRTATARPSRRGRAAQIEGVAVPSDNAAKEALPSRPSRNSYRTPSPQPENTSRQRTVTPRRETRTREYNQPQQQQRQQPVRQRSYESRPSRSYERQSAPQPTRTYEQRSSSSSSSRRPRGN